jgi:hypothetical protein
MKFRKERRFEELEKEGFAQSEAFLEKHISALFSSSPKKN